MKKSSLVVFLLMLLSGLAFADLQPQKIVLQNGKEVFWQLQADGYGHLLGLQLGEVLYAPETLVATGVSAIEAHGKTVLSFHLQNWDDGAGRGDLVLRYLPSTAMYVWPREKRLAIVREQNGSLQLYDKGQAISTVDIRLRGSFFIGIKEILCY